MSTPRLGTRSPSRGTPEGFTLWVFVFDEKQGTFGDARGGRCSSAPVTWSAAIPSPSGQVNTSTEPFMGGGPATWWHAVFSDPVFE